MAKRKFPPIIAMSCCSGCGFSMTEMERVYFGGRCEECTRDDWEKVQRLRFDALPIDTKPVVH